MGNGSAIAIVSAAVLGLFALVWYLIARSFLKLATSTGAVAKVEYREKAARPRSIDRALLGLGAEPVHRQRQLYAQLRHGHPGPGHWRGGAGVEGRQPPSDTGARLPTDPEPCRCCCAALCTLVGMNDMAAPSVSLEGRACGWPIPAGNIVAGAAR